MAVTLTEIEIITRFLLAAFFGGLIGLERDLSRKPVGLRTSALVSLGAALFTVLAAGTFGSAEETARVAAGIVTGVGFLGAGVIFKSENREMVKGLTTAATLWIVAAIGFGAGTGAYITTGIATAAVLIILSLKRAWPRME